MTLFILKVTGFMDTYHQTIRIQVGCQEQAEMMAYVLDHVFGFDVDISTKHRPLDRSEYETFMASKLSLSVHNYMRQ